MTSSYGWRLPRLGFFRGTSARSGGSLRGARRPSRRVGQATGGGNRTGPIRRRRAPAARSSSRACSCAGFATMRRRRPSACARTRRRRRAVAGGRLGESECRQARSRSAGMELQAIAKDGRRQVVHFTTTALELTLAGDPPAVSRLVAKGSASPRAPPSGRRGRPFSRRESFASFARCSCHCFATSWRMGRTLVLDGGRCPCSRRGGETLSFGPSRLLLSRDKETVPHLTDAERDRSGSDAAGAQSHVAARARCRAHGWLRAVRVRFVELGGACWA